MTNEIEFDSIEPMETTQATLGHLMQENPSDETRNDALRLEFDRMLKLEFHGTKVTKVGVKAGIGRKGGCKKTCFHANSKKLSQNRKFFVVQGILGKFIDVVWKNCVVQEFIWEISVKSPCTTSLARYN